MNDLLMTLGITFLLLLVVATSLMIWILWSVRPVVEDDPDYLTKEIERLRAVEQEQMDALRQKVDREWERDAAMDAKLIIRDSPQCSYITPEQFRSEWMGDFKNERTKR